MDGTRFDQLIKHLGTTRLTRLTALRGLAVGALAATIGLADADDADAKCKKKCDQCEKRTRRKTKSGKVRCRCKAKANGTLCSIPGATTATTCLNGTCVAAAGPTPTPTPPAPGPGFRCTAGTETGCTGGQVCNAAGNACVACTSFAQCNGQRVCIDGVCRGEEACGGPGGFKCIEPLNCQDVPGSNTDVCQAFLCSFCSGTCLFDSNPPCSTGRFCRLGYCTKTCAANSDCAGGPQPEQCFTNLCLPI